MENYFDEITVDDFTDPFDHIAQTIGVKNTLDIIRLLGGTQIYIPKLDTLLKEKRINGVRSEFNGFNFRELAEKYGFTERWVREIVKK